MSAYLKLIETIEKVAVSKGASDIHIEPIEEGGYKVRLRIDGKLRELRQSDLLSQEHAKHFFAHAKQRYNFDLGKLGSAQSARFTNYELGYDFRCSLIPCTSRKPRLEKICIRLLPRNKNFDLKAINFPIPTAYSHIVEALNKSNGMIILTGPTGSGKTTTTISALISATENSENTQTLEDPIEYSLSKYTIVQTEIDEKITWSSGLREILRQDPDTIFVGEIRDSETAELAIYAAQTGHLMISTLHTNSAEETFDRLEELGIKRRLVETNLILSTAQRLSSKNCEKCSIFDDEESIKISTILNRKINAKKGRGCENCDFTGYKGRIFLFEYIRRELEDGKFSFKKYGSIEKQAIEFLEKGELNVIEASSVFNF